MNLKNQETILYNWLLAMCNETKENMASGTGVRKNKFNAICDRAKKIMAVSSKKQNCYSREVNAQSKRECLCCND